MNIGRCSGILLHPVSLPGKFGIGSLGKEAYEFIDFLEKSNQKLWQILPLGPTGYGDSPYQCFSAFAGNPLLINLEKLINYNLLTNNDLSTNEKFDDKKIDYGKVINFKHTIFKKAFNNFYNKNHTLEKEFNEFCNKEDYWLKDYSLFAALKEFFNNKSWLEWENDIKLRTKDAIKFYTKKLADKIIYHKFLQFIFFKQWKEIKIYAENKGIKIIGDIPIFVALDSSDAWANKEIFLFDENCQPLKVAGVPPDYFSETGQLWGNPLYNWDYLKSTGYKWWIKRFKATLELVDIIRLDHFRGFCDYWAVPFGEKTAINGKWEKGPGNDFFKKVESALGKLPIIAEDLGSLTPEVHELRDTFEFPGMKILQFAFNNYENNDYLPHNHIKNCVVYTGTHDNDTIKGWFEKESIENKNFIKDYLNISAKNISWDIIRCAWSSVADIAIVPLQDILSLDSSARMNTPGKDSGNWQWRFQKNSLSQKIIDNLSNLTKIYFR